MKEWNKPQLMELGTNMTEFMYGGGFGGRKKNKPSWFNWFKCGPCCPSDDNDPES